MSVSTSKILLSGASGMLGTALVQVLAEKGLNVLQLVRSERPSAAQPFRPDDGNPSPAQAVALAIPGRYPWNPAASPPIDHPKVLEGFTAAIHLSGANIAAHRWTRAYKREMTVSRVESTRALATTLARLRTPPEVLLLASAIGIYGNRGSELLDEYSVPGSGFLADLCQQWEAASEPAVEAGIRVVRLRFGVILGHVQNGGALSRMVPIFRLGLGGPLGFGRLPAHLWMSWISLTDALASILFLLRTPSLAGFVNLTAPNPVTNAEFTRALATALHRPAILRVPAFALRAAFGQMATETLLASARVLPSRLTAAGFEFTFPTIEQALAAALAPNR